MSFTIRKVFRNFPVADSGLPMQRLQSLLREVDSTCLNQGPCMLQPQRSLVPQLRLGAAEKKNREGGEMSLESILASRQ